MECPTCHNKKARQAYTLANPQGEETILCEKCIPLPSRKETPEQFQERQQETVSRVPAHLEKFALMPEEIAATQRLKTSVRYKDTPLKRDLDRIDKKRVRVFNMGRGREVRNLNQAMRLLGTSNVRLVKDDRQFEAVYEKGD